MLLKLKFIGKTSGGASKYEIQSTITPASGNKPEKDNIADILANLKDGVKVNENIQSEDGTFRTITARTHCYLTPNVGDIKELNVVTSTIDGKDITHFSKTIGYDADKQNLFRIKSNTKKELEPIQILTNALESADVSTSDYISLSKALLEISKLKIENKLLEKQLVSSAG